MLTAFRDLVCWETEADKLTSLQWPIHLLSTQLITVSVIPPVLLKLFQNDQNITTLFTFLFDFFILFFLFAFLYEKKKYRPVSSLYTSGFHLQKSLDSCPQCRTYR